MRTKTGLNQQEINWIKDRRFSRLTDNKEVLIYPMGAERYLSQILSGKHPERYSISKDILGKNLLLIPGYGVNGFIFAQSGAKSVIAYDKDPVTIAWMKSFKRFYHYRGAFEAGSSYPSVGELIQALTSWYPPLLRVPTGQFKNNLLWFLLPKSLRRIYLFYLISLVHDALSNNIQGNFEVDLPIEFHVGELNDALKNSKTFDTAFVPYLLGVQNGIEKEQEVLQFFASMAKLVPQGRILVTPSRHTKEFYCFGQRYFTMGGYKNLQSIPGLQAYFIEDDKDWFRTQGIALFTWSNSNEKFSYPQHP